MKIKNDYILDPRKENHLELYSSPMRRFLSGKRLKTIENAVSQIDNVSTILELGCGHGEVLEVIYDPNIKLVGIDINPSSIVLTKERFKSRNNVTILEGDIRKLPYPDESFDVVVCSEVLEHIPNPIEVLTEIKRVLKRHGTFISTVPFEYFLILLRMLILPIRLFQRRSIFVDAHLHYFTKNSYRRLLEKFFTIKVIKRAEFMIRIFAVCVKENFFGGSI